MRRKITILSSVLLLGLAFSCQNLDKDITQVKTDLSAIVDDEIISLKSGDVTDEEIQPAIYGCDASSFRQSMMAHSFNRGCATITNSGPEFPREVTIDFGEGCEGRNGVVRTGKIVINISDAIINEGAVFEVKYENVTIGGRQVELTKTRTNLGQNGDGNWLIETVLDQTITYEDGSSSTRNMNSTNEWISGFGTRDKADDIFTNTGSGSLVTSEGAEFTRDITSPLLFDRSCLYIKSGVIEINKDGTEIVIDFGDGVCDRWATVTIDGVSKEVDLSKKGRGMKGFRHGKKGK
ncbi:MAG: hypothetical protein J7L96_08240 [Bacteroidales bacterium]|nr:hypothetical protein [Bacteroidales bacterium]